MFVGGIGGRTTSFGKLLHLSTKSGVDGVHPNMSLATAADVMMTKAERKGKNTAKIITNQMNTTRLWSILDEEKI